MTDVLQLRDEVLQRANISRSAVEAGFRQHGRAWLCAFHEDRRPSASIKGRRIRCYACNESWDAIALVMRTRSLSFKEAVYCLAEELCIPVPKSTAGELAVYRCRLALAEAEAIRFVEWRFQCIEATKRRRLAILERYHLALRYLNRYANSTLALPQADRLDAFLAKVPAWKLDAALRIVDHFDETIDSLDSRIDRLEAATFDELLVEFRRATAA